MARKDPHGTRGRYHSGCRCARCTAAQREHGRQRRWFTSTRGRTEVPGWRDQYCPICNAGPFVVATTHLVRIHRLTSKEIHERYGVLSSRNFREGTLERFSRGEDAKRMQRKRRARFAATRARWAKLFKEEQARGADDAIKRAAKRWRVPWDTAYVRVLRLQEEGLITFEAPPRREVCRRGHPFTPENTVWRSGDRTCGTCLAASNKARAVRRQKRCVACNKPISENGVRCLSCAATERWKHQRPAACRHGHEFTEANTYWWNGIRHCRECQRERRRRWEARQRAIREAERDPS